MSLGRTVAAGAAGLALALVVALGPRPTVDPSLAPAAVPALAELDRWLAEAEADVPGLRPGTERTIVWGDPAAPRRTPLSVVYLHGFSATRAETAPLADSVAAALGANLHYARLRGHGRDGEALAEATAEEWLADTKEALEIGRRLGDRVVLMGTSTGATLAFWAAARFDPTDDVTAVIALSPNFGPANPGARVLLWPWGGALVRLVMGPTRSWTPANADQARFWTTSYPVGALLPMMAVVDLVDDGVLADVRAPTLVLVSPDDEVIDVDAVRRAFEALGARRAVLEEVEAGGADPSRHVFVGDVLAPDATVPLARRIVRFVEGGG